MPVNKNALIRYKTIDRCLRNKYRRWTLDDLVEACSDALYDAEGITRGVSVRTVQADIQIMRSDKLGYEAPIEVYDNKFYRYADDDYTIEAPKMSTDIRQLIESAVAQLACYENCKDANKLMIAVSQVKMELESILEG